MLSRLKCWVGWHQWDGYQVAIVTYVMHDPQNLTGLHGKELNKEWKSIRACKLCSVEQIFSRYLGWIKLKDKDYK